MRKTLITVWAMVMTVLVLQGIVRRHMMAHEMEERIDKLERRVFWREPDYSAMEWHEPEVIEVAVIQKLPDGSTGFDVYLKCPVVLGEDGRVLADYPDGIREAWELKQAQITFTEEELKYLPLYGDAVVVGNTKPTEIILENVHADPTLRLIFWPLKEGLDTEKACERVCETLRLARKPS